MYDTNKDRNPYSANLIQPASQDALEAQVAKEQPVVEKEAPKPEIPASQPVIQKETIVPQLKPEVVEEVKKETSQPEASASVQSKGLFGNASISKAPLQINTTPNRGLFGTQTSGQKSPLAQAPIMGIPQQTPEKAPEVKQEPAKPLFGNNNTITQGKNLFAGIMKPGDEPKTAQPEAKTPLFQGLTGSSEPKKSELLSNLTGTPQAPAPIVSQPEPKVEEPKLEEAKPVKSEEQKPTGFLFGHSGPKPSGSIFANAKPAPVEEKKEESKAPLFKLNSQPVEEQKTNAAPNLFSITKPVEPIKEESKPVETATQEPKKEGSLFSTSKPPEMKKENSSIPEPQKQQSSLFKLTSTESAKAPELAKEASTTEQPKPQPSLFKIASTESSKAPEPPKQNSSTPEPKPQPSLFKIASSDSTKTPEPAKQASTPEQSKPQPSLFKLTSTPSVEETPEAPKLTEKKSIFAGISPDAPSLFNNKSVSKESVTSSTPSANPVTGLFARANSSSSDNAAPKPAGGMFGGIFNNTGDLSTLAKNDYSATKLDQSGAQAQEKKEAEEKAKKEAEKEAKKEAAGVQKANPWNNLFGQKKEDSANGNPPAVPQKTGLFAGFGGTSSFTGSFGGGGGFFAGVKKNEDGKNITSLIDFQVKKKEVKVMEKMKTQKRKLLQPRLTQLSRLHSLMKIPSIK